MIEKDRIYTPEEAAEELRISPLSVRRALPFAQLSPRVWRATGADILEALKKPALRRQGRAHAAA
jgi:hypothetical protein